MKMIDGAMVFTPKDRSALHRWLESPAGILSFSDPESKWQIFFAAAPDGSVVMKQQVP